MTKVFGRLSLACAILAAAFLCWQPRNAWPAEPAVEVPSADSTETAPDDTTVLPFARIPLSLSLFVRGGYDNNFQTSQSAQGSWFTNEGATLSYDLPGTATRLKLRSGVDLTYRPDQSESLTDNINAYIDGSVIHQVSERLGLNGSVYCTYRPEPDFRSNVGA